MLKVSTATLNLLGQQVLPGYRVKTDATKLPDGEWNLPVDDEVAAHVEANRIAGESDDDVVSRLVRAAIGQRPD